MHAAQAGNAAVCIGAVGSNCDTACQRCCCGYLTAEMCLVGACAAPVAAHCCSPSVLTSQALRASCLGRSARSR